MFRHSCHGASVDEESAWKRAGSKDSEKSIKLDEVTPVLPNEHQRRSSMSQVATANATTTTKIRRDSAHTYSAEQDGDHHKSWKQVRPSWRKAGSLRPAIKTVSKSAVLRWFAGLGVFNDGTFP